MKKIKNIYYLIIILLVSSIVYYFLKNNYIYDSYKSYLTNLKNEFHKLRNLGLDIRNYNIYTIPEVSKKYIIDIKEIRKGGCTQFENKNSIGILLHNHIVLDFDLKEWLESGETIRKKLPQNTVIEKTPNGYHYYFENDLNIDIHNYIQILIKNKPSSIDILGKNNIVTMTPTRINNKEYYWLNSPYTHQFAKLANYNWTLNLTKNSKPFDIYFTNINCKINNKNSFIIIEDISIESEFFYILSNISNNLPTIKFLDGIIYNYDNNYYFLTNNSFKKYNNKKKLFNKLLNLLKKLNVSSIVDLSISYSNCFIENSIIQINNCILDNKYYHYTNNKIFDNYIKNNYKLIKTNKEIDNTVIITHFGNKKDLIKKIENINNIKYEKKIYCSESVYLCMLLSNELKISSLIISIVVDTDNSIINKNKKFLKTEIKETDLLSRQDIIRYFLNNF